MASRYCSYFCQFWYRYKPNTRGQIQFSSPKQSWAEGFTSAPTTNPYRIAVAQSTKAMGMSLHALLPLERNETMTTADTRNGASRMRLVSAHPQRRSTTRRTKGVRNQIQSEYFT